MTPIILLHGALGSKSQLESLKQLLEKSGRVVYSINFSGHSGELFSDEGFGIEVFANDLLRFVKKNKIERADIFGYSMGGYVAVWLAHQHPALINKIVTLGTKFDWSRESAASEVAKLNPEKIEQKVPAFARILQHRHAPVDWKELLHKTADMMLQLGEKPLLTEDIFKSLSCPVKVLLGDKDDMADHEYSKQVAEWIPNSEFQLLTETPHPIEKVNLDLIVKEILQG